MADPELIRKTIADYVARFRDDRDGWLALWAADATMEDPVGSPVRHGIDSIAEFYDQSQASADSVELRADGPVIVLGNEASFRFFARPTLGGVAFSLPAIDVMRFDDDARITSQRAFVDFAMLAPAED